MKIAIHGTSGGYDIFTSEKITGLIDARRDYSKVAAIGQQAYSINFNAGNVIFSKYKIIRDVIGDKRTGNIAFSVIIPNNKKLSGTDVIALLDQLSSEFCEKHIVNDNLNDFRDDWTFIDTIIKPYENKLSHNDEEMQPGTEEAAYVYYSSEEELQKYFDKPYQEEYTAYRQIFFVESESPLNALRHNPDKNLTGQIDLENTRYKLKEFHGNGKNGVSIEVWVDNQKRTIGSYLYKKDNIKIKYSKDYYISIEESGKLADENIRRYLSIVNESKIEVKKDVELEKVKKTILFEIKKRNGEEVTNAEISCKNIYSNDVKKIINNEIEIEGENLKDTWRALAKKDNFSAEREFTPKNQIGKVELILHEHKKIRFSGMFQGQNVPDIKVSIAEKNIDKSSSTTIDFTETEFESSFKVIATCQNGNKYLLGEKTFHPKDIVDGGFIQIELKQSNQPKKDEYSVDAGKHGSLKEGGPYYSMLRSGDDVRDKIIPNKIYKLKGFELENRTLIAQYRLKPIVWISIVIGIITIGVLIGLLIFKKPDTKQDVTQKVIEYCDGIKLNKDTLESYKIQYCNTESAIQATSIPEKSWKNLWGFFGNSEKQSKSKKNSSLPGYCSKIENAIGVRNAINLGEIDKFKNRTYSTTQVLFENAVKNIDEKFKGKIGQTMNAHTVSAMNLNEIADFINNLQRLLSIRDSVIILTDTVQLKSKKTEIEGMTTFPVDSIKNNIKTEIDKEIKRLSPKQNQQQRQNQSAQQQQQQGQQSQQQQQQQQTSALKKDFWRLVHDGNVQKDTYTKLYNQHKSKSYTKGTEENDIVAFLKKICENTASFNKFKTKLNGIDAIDKPNINSLTQIDI